MAASAGLRTKELMLQNLKKRLRDDMNSSYRACRDEDSTYESAFQQAEARVKSRFPGKNQMSYLDIPVFPYKNDANNNRVDDFLPANHSYGQLKKLFDQLAEHALQVASLVISTDTTKDRPFGQLAVTPIAPPEIADPGFVGLDAAKGAVEPENSKAAAKRAKLEKSLAGPHAKVASKPPLKKDEEKKKRAREKDTYHIIRINIPYKQKYLELLRQDSDGYIIAFRILRLTEFKTAYWCLFNDFYYLRNHLTFFEWRDIHYDSGYQELNDIYYGRGTLCIIIDSFLVKLYSDHGMKTTDEGRRYFHILCLLFGECPRLEALRQFVKENMKTSHFICSGSTSYQLGSLLSNLIRKWSNTCDTAFYLLLAEFEALTKEDIEKEYGNASERFADLFRDFDYTKSKAHDRCNKAMIEFGSIFKLIRDPDQLGRLHMYQGLSLYLILNEQLHLLKHHNDLVTGIILRQGRYRDKLSLGCFTDSKGIAVESPEQVFWSHYQLFVQSHYPLPVEKQNSEKRVMDLMLFLEAAHPFLRQYGFEEGYPAIFNEVVAKCHSFKAMEWSRNECLVEEAACKAMKAGRKWEDSSTDVIIGFLASKRALPA